MSHDQLSGGVCKFNPWLKRDCSHKIWHYHARLRPRKNTLQWTVPANGAAHRCLSQWRKPSQTAAAYAGQSRLASSTVWQEKCGSSPGSSSYAMYVCTMRICCLH